MDDQSGTLFAAVLTLLALPVILVAILALTPIFAVFALIYFLVELGSAPRRIEAEGGELESQPPERP